MVYVDPDDLRWKPIIQTWLNEYSDKLKIKDETKVSVVCVLCSVYTYNMYCVCVECVCCVDVCTNVAMFTVLYCLQQYIMELFNSYVDAGLKFVKKSCSQGIDQVNKPLLVTIVTGHQFGRLMYQKWSPSVAC